MTKCTYLIQIPSGNPEPDFPGDLWLTVECGAAVTTDTDGWHCEAGHEHLTYGSPSQQAAEAAATAADRAAYWAAATAVTMDDTEAAIITAEKAMNR